MMKSKFWLVFMSALVLIVGLGLAFHSPSIFAIGDSGYNSSKSLGGNLTSLLVISPTADGTTTIATQPAVQTDAATATAVNPSPSVYTTATLNGQVTDLRGLSTSLAWFEWGYTPAFGTTVGSTTLSGTGSHSYVLTGFQVNRTVYYRFVAETDSRTNGSARTIYLNSIDGYTGLRTVLGSGPLLIFIILVFAGSYLIYTGGRSIVTGGVATLTNLIQLSLGLLFLGVGFIMFQVVIDATNNMLVGG